MTVLSERAIAWDIPSRYPSNVRPGAETMDFAAWLQCQEPTQTNELGRLNNIVDFLCHVSFTLSPSKHNAKGPCQHRIRAAYCDKRIEQEFHRWMNHLDWSEVRHAYLRTMHTLMSPLATGWLMQCCNNNPRTKFALQLMHALQYDDFPENVSNTERSQCLQAMSSLGLNIERLSTTTALDQCLHAIQDTPQSLGMQQQVNVFTSLYDPTYHSNQPLNTRRGMAIFRNALFIHLAQTYNQPTPTPNEMIALPEHLDVSPF